MISGATGALAVVMSSLVIQHGVEYLFATVVLMGVFQVLSGILKLGRFIRLIPHPVMLGFVNGLAIVIFLAQLGQFKAPDPSGVLVWMEGTTLYIMLFLVALTMGIIYLLPKLTKAVPAPLAAILVVFGITQFFNIETRSVGDMASIAGGLPMFHIPDVPLTWETLRIILPYSVTLAGIGLIESLLTLSLVDEITGTKGGNSRECMALGLSNMVSGFFGTMGGCAMIGQSMINVSSGARKRLSGIVAAISLLSFILYGAPLIEQIPLAALVGVMFMVVIGTFAWSSFRIMMKIPPLDALVILLVSGVTVAFDLAIAVLAGVIFSALVYAWKSAKHIGNSTTFNTKKGEKTYHLYGPLFFGSITSFKDLFNVKEDPKGVLVDFEHSRIWDHSGLEAIIQLTQQYRAEGKVIRYAHLSSECSNLLEKAGVTVERDHEELPHYQLLLTKKSIS